MSCLVYIHKLFQWKYDYQELSCFGKGQNVNFKVHTRNICQTHILGKNIFGSFVAVCYNQLVIVLNDINCYIFHLYNRNTDITKIQQTIFLDK